MSHHGDHSDHAPGQAHPPPGIPDVKDEAGDTPPWVPKLGIALGALLVGLIVLSIVLGEKTAPVDAPAADEQTEAAQ